MGDSPGEVGKVVPDVASVVPVSISVREFVEESAPELRLDVLRGREYLENRIGSAQLQKLGMAMLGTSGDVHPDRVQVVGHAEFNFLQSMEEEDRQQAMQRTMQRIRRHEICCIVVVQGAVVPEELFQLSSERRIPFIQSGEPSDSAVAKITRWLEKRLAPRITLHGCLLDVFGLGVLILGPSGIGKSECALELVLKSHRLIADDYIEITRHGIDQPSLSGEGGKVLRHHMELRGLGIIDIKELYGISATGATQNIDFIVRLERWKADGVYDRLGIEKSSLDILGVPLPVIDIPVAPGRNVATLVEVAARIHLLHQRGYKTSDISELSIDG
ncbi:MAG: HPr(Ser) kinase/phosphatase [Acidobacteriota bacterium]|jgi:HPr kinase/phosphorylase|nr:HPr(Ser) kinase/phosphatase [Acidobacteriota bacterium]